MRILRWTGWDGAGLEHAMVSEGPGAVVARGVVAGRGFGLSYRLALDTGWRSRSLRVEATDGRALALEADGEGGWRDGRGRTLGALAGCLDVDAEATPLTNALPIRRLGLAVGEAAEIAAVHVSAPGLSLRRAAQRYARLGERLWRYEGLDTGASAEIEVDEAGFPLTYPGAFRRAQDIDWGAP